MTHRPPLLRVVHGAVVPALLVLLLGAIRSAAGAPPAVEKPDPLGIHWTNGPATVNIGSIGTLKVPAGYRFADSAGAALWNRATHNPSGNELGLLQPRPGSGQEWFMSFSFDDMGYVKDDEKLDNSTIDSILQSVKDGTEKANEERKRNGWETMSVVGWEQRPFYDSATHNLTWAIRGKSSAGDESVNYDSRVLGRRGVMRVKLVDDPTNIAAAVPAYNLLIGAIAFNSGESYAEYRSGDKIAEYGLVGLITGGTAVVAFKFWKPLMAFGAVIVAGIGSIFRKIKGAIFGRKA